MRWAPLAALALVELACAQADFEGDRGEVQFTSTLSHQYTPWWPAVPVALGSRASVYAFGKTCLPPCAGNRPGGNVALPDDGGVPALRVVARDDAGTWTEFEAVALGRAEVQWFARQTDLFTVEVRRAASVGLSDPLLYNKRAMAQYIGFDGAAWPDVGEGLAIGAGAQLALETMVRDGKGVPLGFDPAQLTAEVSPDSGWALAVTRHLVDVQAPQHGSAEIALGWGDGGVAARIAARVAEPEEAASVTVLMQPIEGSLYLLKAVVVLADGGTFFEPPIEWSADADWEPRPEILEKLQLRPRRDVRLYTWVGHSSPEGLVRSRVTATVGGATGEAVVEREYLVLAGGGDSRLGPAACASAPGGIVLWVLLAALGARHRSGSSGLRGQSTHDSGPTARSRLTDRQPGR